MLSAVQKCAFVAVGCTIQSSPAQKDYSRAFQQTETNPGSLSNTTEAKIKWPLCRISMYELAEMKYSICKNVIISV